MAAKAVKKCDKCGTTKTLDLFTEVKSVFFPDKHLNICKDCIEGFLLKNEGNFTAFDKLCQWADIPFLVNEWMKIYKYNKGKTFDVYCRAYIAGEYNSVDWRDITQQYKEMASNHNLEANIEVLQEEKIRQLQKKWGSHYDAEELAYLENLFQGILTSHNVVGEIPLDNAKKLCKISLLIDNRIRAEEDFKDELASYDKLLKTAEFTPKNMKNASDFNSVGEIFLFLEKGGWINKFYDWAERDIIDNSMKNIQLYNRNLYINENGISEEINRKIEALQVAQQLEDNMFHNDDSLDAAEVAALDIEEEFLEDVD